MKNEREAAQTPDPLFNHSHTLRVRWAEVDMQGVVFNGHYLTYFDIGMTEYMRDLPYPYPQGLAENGTDLYMVKTTVEYKGSARYDDLLDIRTRVARVGRSSLTFAFEIVRQGEPVVLATGESVYVNVDLKTRQSAPLPEPMIAKIRALEGPEAPPRENAG